MLTLTAPPVGPALEITLDGIDIIGIEWGLPCPDCDSPLSLSQPDEADPRRLIGYCDPCQELFLLLEHTHGTRVYRLPPPL